MIEQQRQQQQQQQQQERHTTKGGSIRETVTFLDPGFHETKQEEFDGDIIVGSCISNNLLIILLIMHKQNLIFI